MSKVNAAAPVTEITSDGFKGLPKVSLAYLQTGVTWLNKFTTQTAISSDGQKGCPKGMTIYLQPDGSLHLFHDGEHAVIPAANVKIALLK